MYLTPAAYKRKAEEEEREKKKRMKKDEEEVDPIPINSHQKIPDEFKFF